ncbi:DUF3592 domain-containing protein [Burkholderia sp. F1]|uniref:DUF3592 domain-containing protein n=1 Tax=Burkholderia sp. F1 TaxID=3366817 RepID=UPI003D7396EB
MYKVIAGFVFGIVFLVVAGFTGLSTREFLRTAIAVPGEVVALNAGGSHPQIEFVTKAGERISYPQGGIISGMKVGDKVTVLYRPDAPSIKPTIDRFGAVWDVTLTMLFIGVVGIVAALTNLPSRK